jgi:transcription termination factor NusB
METDANERGWGQMTVETDLARLDERVENVEKRQGTIDVKIDKFIDKWDARFIGLLVTTVGLLAVGVVNLLILLAQRGR